MTYILCLLAEDKNKDVFWSAQSVPLYIKFSPPRKLMSSVILCVHDPSCFLEKRALTLVSHLTSTQAKEQNVIWFGFFS